MFGIPLTQVVNLLQNALLLFGASFVTKGLMTGDQLTTIVSGLATGVVVVINAVTHDDAIKALPKTKPEDAPKQ